MPHSGVSGRAQACIRLPNQDNVGEFFLQRANLVDTAIRCAVIDDDDLVAAGIEILILKTAQATLDVGLDVVGGQYDADPDHVCSPGLRSCPGLIPNEY